MNLLLDTCTFLWFATADKRLPPSVVALLRSPDNPAWLSVASFWEISVKHDLGRLPLPDPPATYVPSRRLRLGFASLPLSEEAIVHLAKLPRIHADPFDRMLICQAIENDLVIVTPDPQIQAYPVKTFWRD